VALGMEDFVRLNVDKLPASGALLDRLHELMLHALSRGDSELDSVGYRGGDTDAVHVRAVAAIALGEAGALDAEWMGHAFEDPAPDVRAGAAPFIAKLSQPDRGGLLRHALDDPSPHVRFAGVRALVMEPRTASACSTLQSVATSDPAASVRLIALDGLGQPCPDRSAQAAVLRRVAASFDSTNAGDWHQPAAALVSLARVAPSSAADLLPRFLARPDPFVRAWAAQAAGALGRISTLDSLAADPDDNVRTAAVRELGRLQGHDADSVLLAQMDRDDPQLLLTAAELLKGSPRGMEVARATLSAFERISHANRETWRDPRRALLARVGELGDSSLAPSLEPYLRDYDPKVAEDVAGILSRWTGHAVQARPEPLSPLALPTAAQLDSLERTEVLLHMRRGGTIEIRLFPDIAPTNAFRFVRQAREGRFDGLTFHRVVPNFVVQGGSPSANEYQGSPLFTRDEVGLPVNWRGTVGLSTRGHDTGDGQVYINLADNLRLDHQYTVWGEVVSGMDVVDAIEEGDVIDRAEVRTED
jgi:cyclophilin family peptidyl-prolyl cis-trans isomerase/HEAT repeat protein